MRTRIPLRLAALAFVVGLGTATPPAGAQVVAVDVDVFSDSGGGNAVLRGGGPGGLFVQISSGVCETPAGSLSAVADGVGAPSRYRERRRTRDGLVTVSASYRIAGKQAEGENRRGELPALAVTLDGIRFDAVPIDGFSGSVAASVSKQQGQLGRGRMRASFRLGPDGAALGVTPEQYALLREIASAPGCNASFSKRGGLTISFRGDAIGNP